MKDETKKISKNREGKETIVAELSEKANKAKAMVFTNFGGMKHQQIEELKKGLRKLETEVVVAKNTLVKRALADGKDKIEVEDTLLQGPTATLFAYADPILPLKELAKVIKTLKLPTIKFGIFEGKIITETEVTKLATLPSREILLAQLACGLKSPLFGLHRALNWNLQKLVMTLNAIQTKKQTS